MDLAEVQTTAIWDLLEQGKNYCRRINMYSDTDKNYRFYNGNQWEGLKVVGIEPVQLNFIKPIVKYKVGIINANLWSIHYSAENFENKEFRKEADKVCELLNKKAAKVWEKDNLDSKIRKVSKDSAINDLGIMYVTYDKENQTPINEIIAKNDIYFGNENDGDIQRQPYILIKQRRSVIELQQLARKEGVSEEKIQYIVADNDYFEESGESAKIEKDAMCTLVTKFYRNNDGKIWYAKATRYAEIVKETNSGLSYYPISIMPWEEKEGSARGEGEVRNLIANQIEVNKTVMRRLITVKQTAYPQKIANITKIQNPSDINKVGSIIEVNEQTVDDVSKIFSNVAPAQMSPDVEKVQNELINSSRDLAGAGDIATGDVNPEDASGKAILAVQQASQQPLVEQLISLKAFVEDIARIWLDMFIVYSSEGLTLEEEIVDPKTGETIIEPVRIAVTVLEELKAIVKVDITPKGAFDKYAQEVSLENLLKAGYFNQQRIGELKIYVKLLDDDSVMPKQKLEEAIELMEEEQKRIATINAQAQLMKQRVNQFLNNDIDAQAQQLAEAQMQDSQVASEEYIDELAPQ